MSWFTPMERFCGCHRANSVPSVITPSLRSLMVSNLARWSLARGLTMGTSWTWAFTGRKRIHLLTWATCATTPGLRLCPIHRRGRKHFIPAVPSLILALPSIWLLRGSRGNNCLRKCENRVEHDRKKYKIVDNINQIRFCFIGLSDLHFNFEFFNDFDWSSAKNL